MAGFTRVVLTQDIGTADPISMRPKTTSRTVIMPSLGFVTVQTLRAGLASVGFGAEGNADARRLCLVGDGGTLASVRPEADFLLAFRVQVLAICHVAYIANNQGSYLPLFGPCHDGAADLVFQITGMPLLFGKEARLAALQAFPASGTPLLAILPGPQFSQALGSVLVIGTQRSAGNNAGFLAIRQRGGVYLPHVHCRRACTRGSLWHTAILYH